MINHLANRCLAQAGLLRHPGIAQTRFFDHILDVQDKIRQLQAVAPAVGLLHALIDGPVYLHGRMVGQGHLAAHGVGQRRAETPLDVGHPALQIHPAGLPVQAHKLHAGGHVAQVQQFAFQAFMAHQEHAKQFAIPQKGQFAQLLYGPDGVMVQVLGLFNNQGHAAPLAYRPPQQARQLCFFGVHVAPGTLAAKAQRLNHRRDNLAYGYPCIIQHLQVDYGHVSLGRVHHIAGQGFLTRTGAAHQGHEQPLAESFQQISRAAFKVVAPVLF